jgi:hypothetical protein
MLVYEICVPQMTKMLTNLQAWLDKATACAEKKKFDVNNLVQARLSPDMFPLARQIQSAADNAKLAAARLAGKQAPSHPDTETTVNELKARLQTVIDYLATFTPEDFAGAEDRAIRMPFFPDKTIQGRDYLAEWVVPNTYFHLVTAYAILRHNGVELGKQDYIGSMKLVPA